MASFTWITLMLATLPFALCEESRPVFSSNNNFEYQFGVLNKLESLQKETDHLKEEVNVQTYTNRELADQVTVLTGQVTELVSENQILNATVNGLQAYTNTELAEQVTELVSGNQILNTTVNKLQEYTNTELATQVTELVAANQILNTTVNELQAYTNTELAEQVTELLLENRRFNTTLNGLLNGTSQSRSKSSGTTYIRWGRTSCPSTSQLVYDGYAGGSYYQHTGGGANYLCLPKDPLPGEQSAGGSGGGRTNVYGAEYETHSTAWNNKADLEVPCAVCRSVRSNVLMIPARSDCYSRWTQEYSGYLMSSSHTHSSSTEFVCMDGEPEGIGRIANDNGALFYLVSAQCGSLPCPPYNIDDDLTCVVCSYA